MKAKEVRPIKVIHELAVNGGTVKAAMLKAGYSEEYANNPQKLLNTATFQEILNAISDDVLMTEAYKVALSDDKRAKLSAIELIMKLKGRMNESKVTLRFQAYEDVMKELSEPCEQHEE